MVGLTDFSLGLLAQHYAEAEDFQSLDILVKGLLLQRPRNSSLNAIQAYAHHRLGRAADAAASIACALELNGREPFVNFYAGRMAAETGDNDAALRHFSSTIDAMPWFAPAHDGLNRILFPGLQYRQVLAAIHEALRPAVYLEIGVNNGESLALAIHSEVRVGVDPDLSLCPPELGRQAQLFATTSDDFFAGLDRGRTLQDRPVDLGFIDGMHLFEYCLRDFANLERLCRPDATILIHDVVPVSARLAQRERTSGVWTGDVWKLVPCLAQYRPDLDLSLVMTGPSGLAVVRHLDPSSTVLHDRMDEIVANYGARDFIGMRYWQGLALRCVPADAGAVARLVSKGAG
jgi:hypothetical protein